MKRRFLVNPRGRPARPLTERSGRIYARLRAAGYTAKDAHHIAKVHNQAARLDVVVEWQEDSEASYEEGAPRWIVSASYRGKHDSLGGVDLGEVGPDAHHSDLYQYDAEAQVLGEVLP